MRRIALLALIQLVLLSACGGSGSSDLGSGSSSGGGSTGTSPAANVVALTVDGGPTSTLLNFNVPYVTVTICAPGSTTNCQTIDHVEIDTASYGLRIISSVLNPTLLAALPPETTSAGVPIAECVEFGDGYVWGTMRTADMKIASEKAAGIPMQVMGDPNIAGAPPACISGAMGPEEDTVAAFGANGIIGLGPFVQDCGQACVDSTSPGFYYSCPAGTGSCNYPVQVTLAQEAINPVAAFTADNNGVIVEMPSVADAGAMQATGSLVFGIGTQSNNSLGNATVLTTDPNNGNISVTFAGNNYPGSFIDSGSNLIFFDLESTSTVAIAQCTIKDSSDQNSESFYCPSSEQTLTAINSGQNGTQSTVTFKVANAQTLLNSDFAAFNNLAAPSTNTSTFDFGLPFFYGRNVYTAIDGMNTSGGMGPYIAY